MWLFVGDTQPTKIFVGDTAISKVFLGDQQVRPSGWRPSSDTLAYYPLRSDFNNAYWSLGNLTSVGTNTFIDDGVANINICQSASSSHLRLPSVTVDVSKWFTYSIWCRTGSFGNFRPHFVHTRAGTSESAKCFADIQWFNSSGTIVIYTDFPTNSSDKSTSTTTSVYSNRVVTLEQWWSNMKFYKNGTLVRTKTVSITTNQTLGIFYLWAWWEASWFVTYLSDFIIENKERTADDVTKYYSWTQWNYWL